MLVAHMNAVEDQLVTTSRIPANAGHSLHKGTPRETFISQFLEDHLSANVTIGTGEIIDANSRPNEPRNQLDIVIYSKQYPKIAFSQHVHGFLIESVVATIEIKSILDRAGIDQAIRAAHRLKNLVSSSRGGVTIGWIPPKVLNYVVAYDGPEAMQTVVRWILDALLANGIPMPRWTRENRLSVPGTSLDGVIVLKKGFVKLDNTPLSMLKEGQNASYFYCDSEINNLLILFLSLQEACNNLQGKWFEAAPYVQSARYRPTWLWL